MHETTNISGFNITTIDPIDNIELNTSLVDKSVSNIEINSSKKELNNNDLQSKFNNESILDKVINEEKNSLHP
jgi:hypothetical protein